MEGKREERARGGQRFGVDGSRNHRAGAGGVWSRREQFSVLLPSVFGKTLLDSLVSKALLGNGRGAPRPTPRSVQGRVQRPATRGEGRDAVGVQNSAQVGNWPHR